jgi:NAD(P)-dependent dehydrogenase (short-subunit alcohol dehydrogenase family)
MNNMLNGKKIVVTGAGGLLGANVVKSILEAGGAVVATDISLGDLKTRLSSFGANNLDDNLTILELNICHSEGVKKFWGEMEGITGAVNCAYPRAKGYGAHFFDVTLETFNDNVSLHLGSAFLFMQQCASYFIKNKVTFSLVNFSSIYGVIAPKF